MTAAPALARSRSSCSASSWWFGSSWLVGSSSRKMRGVCARTAASAARRRSPLERVSTSRSSYPARPTATSALDAMARSRGDSHCHRAMWGCRPRRTVSMTLAGKGSSTFCGSSANSRASARRGQSLMRFPEIRTSPALGERRPARVCRERLLPEPFGPSTASIEPGPTCRLSPRTRVRDCTQTSTPLHSSSGAATSGALRAASESMLRPAYFECGGGAYDHFIETLRLLPFVGCEHAPSRHDFRGPLRIKRYLHRIAIAIRETRGVVDEAVLIRGAHGMQQLVRNHHIVAAVHLRRRKRVDHADETLGESQGMRHGGGQRRVVVQHEHTNILGLMYVS